MMCMNLFFKNVSSVCLVFGFGCLGYFREYRGLFLGVDVLVEVLRVLIGLEMYDVIFRGELISFFIVVGLG